MRHWASFTWEPLDSSPQSVFECLLCARNSARACGSHPGALTPDTALSGVREIPALPPASAWE